MGWDAVGWGGVLSSGSADITRWRVLFVVGLGSSRGGLPAPTLKVAESLCFAVKALLLSAENRERVVVLDGPLRKGSPEYGCCGARFDRRRGEVSSDASVSESVSCLFGALPGLLRHESIQNQASPPSVVR